MRLGTALFFTVSAEGGGVPCAGFASLLHAGNFPLKVLDLVVLFFDEATEGSTKFGTANSAARQEAAHIPLDNQLQEESSDVKTLKGYFDNLAAAEVKEKRFLSNWC